MKGLKPTLLYLVQTDWFFRSHRLPLALAAQKLGFHVALAARFTSHESELRDLGIGTYPLAHLGGSRLNPFHEARALREIVQLYRRLQPALVHHVSLRPVLHGGLAARWTGVPAAVHAVTGLGYLFHSTNPVTGLVRSATSRALRSSLSHPVSRTIFQNVDDLDEFVVRGMVQRDRTVLIPGSGVDLERFRHSGAENDPPIVLFGARMLEEKGAADLVEAALLLKERGIACRVLLAGAPDEGNPGAIPVHVLKEWHAAGVVEWLGHREDMPQLLARADIACLPSYYREGIPKFLIEATAAGLPIVTTDMPGCRETIDHGRNGLLVEPRNTEMLADSLERLLQNRDLREEMGTASRELAERRFSLDAVVDAHVTLYATLAQDAGIDLG